jgi:hypothetical protein
MHKNRMSALFFVSAVTITMAAASADADICFIGAGGVRYQLQIGTGNGSTGTPIVVTGTRVIAQFRTPVFGSAMVSGSTIVIGLNEAFDFGTGSFTHPNATTVFRFPPAGGGGPTFDTTFHGNGAPHNVKGALTGTTCPVAASAPDAKDPNAR